MIIEDNNYFEEKNKTIKLIEIYFESHPIDRENIARLYWESVEASDDTERLIISEIIFYHAIWKIANGLPTSGIESVKRRTNEIIQSNPTFTHLNAEEYEDFIKIVKELSETEIEVFRDNR
jgi:hypothetical protein